MVENYVRRKGSHVGRTVTEEKSGNNLDYVFYITSWYCENFFPRTAYGCVINQFRAYHIQYRHICNCLALFYVYLENIGFVYPALSMVVIGTSLLY